MNAPTPHVDAADVAALILASFRAYRTRFREITLAAKTRFEARAWLDGQRASALRIEIYKDFMNSLAADIRARLGEPTMSPPMSRSVKGA
ncbi:MAG TPA: isocitrate dehydrogenase kinase/phosphatase AceK regulatory subunit, partial [Pseudomonadales bacterium]|nr:isocitrate dehydrogenase kinase/phosphatase AceK regulatory subunit [Pseudomonadales bacterium]